MTFSTRDASWLVTERHKLPVSCLFTIMLADIYSTSPALFMSQITFFPKFYGLLSTFHCLLPSPIRCRRKVSHPLSGDGVSAALRRVTSSVAGNGRGATRTGRGHWSVPGTGRLRPTIHSAGHSSESAAFTSRHLFHPPLIIAKVCWFVCLVTG